MQFEIKATGLVSNYIIMAMFNFLFKECWEKLQIVLINTDINEENTRVVRCILSDGEFSFLRSAEIYTAKILKIKYLE